MCSQGPPHHQEHKKDVIGKPEFVEVSLPPISRELKKRWSHFIQKVHGTDPLVIPSDHWLRPLTAIHNGHCLPSRRAFKPTRRNSIAL